MRIPTQTKVGSWSRGLGSYHKETISMQITKTECLWRSVNRRNRMDDHYISITVYERNSGDKGRRTRTHLSGFPKTAAEPGLLNLCSSLAFSSFPEGLGYDAKMDAE